jgi:hypothetical protein
VAFKEREAFPAGRSHGKKLFVSIVLALKVALAFGALRCSCCCSRPELIVGLTREKGDEGLNRLPQFCMVEPED